MDDTLPAKDLEATDIAHDGDIRYRADIQGYPRDVRRRVRETQRQANLLVTARIRDTNTAAEELAAGTIGARVRELVLVTRMSREQQATRGDLRSAYVSLAATAIICAEHADRPTSIEGARLRPSRNSTVLRVD